MFYKNKKLRGPVLSNFKIGFRSRRAISATDYIWRRKIRHITSDLDFLGNFESNLWGGTHRIFRPSPRKTARHLRILASSCSVNFSTNLCITFQQKLLAALWIAPLKALKTELLGELSYVQLSFFV